MRSKCHSSLTFTVCCLNASLCVGAAQQQQRAAQWVRSCKALAPSLHHLSISTRLIFALPLSVFTPSTLTPGVFIRWVGALSTVSLQLILTVLLLSPPPPPDTWFRSGESHSRVFCCYRIHYYHTTMSAFCQRTHSTGLGCDLKVFFYPNSLSFSLSCSLSISSWPGWLCLGFTGVGLLLIWSAVCFWFPHLISCQHPDWPWSVCTRLALRHKACLHH